MFRGRAGFDFEACIVKPQLDSGKYEFKATRNNRNDFSVYTKRDNPAVEIVGTKVYVVAPLLRRRHMPQLTTVAILDLVDNEWRWLSVFGPSAQCGSLFLYDDSLFFYGANNWQLNEEGLSRFDLLLEEWSDFHCTGDYPGQRRGHSGHVLENRGAFFVFGGKRNIGPVQHATNDVFFLNMASRVWTAPRVSGRAPVPRWKHGSCVCDNVFYCYGGHVMNGRATDGLFLLHLNIGHTLSWSKPKTTGEEIGPISSFTLTPLRHTLILAGGLTSAGDHDFSSYDTVTNSFKKLRVKRNGLLVEALFNHAACISNDGSTIMLFGGDIDLRNYLRVTML